MRSHRVLSNHEGPRSNWCGDVIDPPGRPGRKPTFPMDALMPKHRRRDFAANFVHVVAKVGAERAAPIIDSTPVTFDPNGPLSLDLRDQRTNFRADVSAESTQQT
jgi:hypothetical protein